MVIKINDEECQLNPRAAEIVRWLTENQELIASQQLPFGAATFNFAGRKMSPEVTRSLRTVDVPGEQVKVTVK